MGPRKREGNCTSRLQSKSRLCHPDECCCCHPHLPPSNVFTAFIQRLLLSIPSHNGAGSHWTGCQEGGTASLLSPNTQIHHPMLSCYATEHNEMQLGRKNWKAGSLSKTLGQGDVLSPVPKQRKAAGSSKSPICQGRTGLTLAGCPMPTKPPSRSRSSTGAPGRGPRFANLKQIKAGLGRLMVC